MHWVKKALLYTKLFLGLLVAGVVLQERRIELFARNRDQERVWSTRLGATAVDAFAFGSLVIWGLCWSRRNAGDSFVTPFHRRT